MAEHVDDDQSEEAAPWDLLANALGSLSELEDDDDLELDVHESFGGEAVGNDPFHKVPLEQAGNLIKLRKAAAAVLDGRITVDKYVALVRSFIQPLEDGIHLLKSAPVQKQIDELPDDQLPIFTHLHNQLEQLLEGLRIMTAYKQSADPADVEQGLETVEEAMRGLDQTQDQAIEKGTKNL